MPAERGLRTVREDMERLSEQRRVMLGRNMIDPRRGLPVEVCPPSGVGGDIPENREPTQ